MLITKTMKVKKIHIRLFHSYINDFFYPTTNIDEMDSNFKIKFT